MDASTAFEARQRREIAAAFKFGSQFLAAHRAGDSDRMASIRRQFNAMPPFRGE